MFLEAAMKGLIAGVIGTAAMTVAENVEQKITHRSDSYVPARTMSRHLHLRSPDRKSLARNWTMHWGTGAVVGMARGVIAANGLRSAMGSTLHLGLRLSTDQFLENRAGTSRPPTRWPREELAIDLFHKAVYAYVTGAILDRLLAERAKP
jgi:hypothetical protein